MNKTITSTLQLQLSSTFANALADGTTISDNYTPDAPIRVTFATGDIANGAQVQWHDRRTLAAAGTDNIDLSASLMSAFGVVTFTKVKALLVRLRTTTAGDSLVVGGHATAAWVGPFGAASNTVTVLPGGWLFLVAPDLTGYPVVADTGDILKIYNPSNETVEYDIVIIGTGSTA